jgi:2-polyprenyl-6-methoxyphenol hydroxylase-like FAD-dependent oxidoreductase
MKILIVGAGPTGLTVGVELARLGIMADIIDRRENPSQLSRAVGITPRSLELLKASGATDILLKDGIKLRNAEIFLGRKRALSVPIKDTGLKYGFLLALPQNRTEAALRKIYETAGNKIRYGTALKTLAEKSVGIHVTLADADAGLQHAIYDYVIGADGVDSQVRKSSNIEYAGYDLPETWSIADVNARDWQHPSSFTVCILSNSAVAVVAPIGPDRYRVISNTEDALSTLPLPLEIIKTRRTGQFKISIRQVADYNKGRVFLAGDAAHCHSPVGGRGMNLGIADAAQLAQCFKTGELAAYSAARHKDAEQTIHRTERARRFITSANAGKRALLRVGLKTVDQLPFLQTRIAHTILTA